MPGKSRGQPPKAVIAIPSEPVRKAGGKALEFPSLKAAAAFFGIHKTSLSRIIIQDRKKRPSSGFYFDYKIESL